MKGLVAVMYGSVLLASLGWTAAWGQAPTVPGGGGSAAEGSTRPGTEGGIPWQTRPEQTQMQMGFPPLAGVVDPATYRLGPGDVLHLQMWGRLTRSLFLQVGPEGVVVVPGLGTLKVSDRTLAEAQSELLSRLRSYFRGVNVDVRLASPRAFTVFLTGHVKVPGPTVANGANRAADVLARDVLLDGASRRQIRLHHVDGTREVVDLDLFLRLGDDTMNPWLRDGDVIRVPSVTHFVDALGALASPGRFELGTQDSLITLFHLAGGAIPSADSARAVFLRWKDSVTPESLHISLDDVYARRFNPPLRGGDRLYVYYVPDYHLQHEASVVGQVVRPGTYPIREGDQRLSDLIASAGGFVRTADSSSIQVLRRNPRAVSQDPELDRLLRLSRDQLTSSEYEKLRTKLAGLRETYRVDWKRLQNDPRLDLLVRDGDVLSVDRLANSIRVDGEVRRPGLLTYAAGLSVRDYIQQAGGLTDRSWSKRIQVTRAVTGQTLLAHNVRVVDPGDFVWVPERPDKTAWDYTRELLTALTQSAAVILVIRSFQ